MCDNKSYVSTSLGQGVQIFGQSSFWVFLKMFWDELTVQIGTQIE